MNTQPNTEKIVYVPYMCDHSYVLVAGLQAHGIQSAPIPPPDEVTLALGLEVCRGRECLPCFNITGDMLRLARQPDFEPARAQILMVTSCGPCRFGQYVALQRGVLADHGFGEIEFISPTHENNYDGFGRNPTRLRMLMWEGIVAVDLLLKLLHTFRPYELQAGQTDALYALCLQDVLTAVRQKGGRRLVRVMAQVAARFEQLPVAESPRRPLIGLVGENYLRLNAFSNQELIRKVEAQGGEVVMAPLIEWLYFINWGVRTMTKAFGAHLPYFLANLTDIFQQRRERRLAKPVAHLLSFPYETPVDETLASLKPYYEKYLGTEAVLTMGKGIEWARHGFAGIVNVMPFTCMPGLISAGMTPSFRADIQNIPWLDISYEAQKGTNVNTRLEAFMFQAQQYHQRTPRKNETKTRIAL